MSTAAPLSAEELHAIRERLSGVIAMTEPPQSFTVWELADVDTLILEDMPRLLATIDALIHDAQELARELAKGARGG